MERNPICSFTFHKMIVTFCFRPSHYLDAHIFWELTNVPYTVVGIFEWVISGFPAWWHMWIKLYSQSLWFKHGDLQDEESQSLWGSMVDHDCFIVLLIWGGSKDKEVNGECSGFFGFGFSFHFERRPPHKHPIISHWRSNNLSFPQPSKKVKYPLIN